MPAPQRLLVVSHRAPVEVSRTPEGTRVTRVLGGLTDALNPMMEERGGAWIAWAAPFTDDVLTPAATGLSYPIHAVRLREPEVSSFNAGFANQVLWPLCHMFPTRCRFQPTYWTAYRQAN